ncbi:hypothetical protein F5884DRAFT_868834 [Xylogone sp. PMI_703]|nr:hypothetical protein F5884DRAFT_868834 [Xylogone sp. PMI_703]
MARTQQSIKRLLVINRGEIAVRIFCAARELPIPIETIALYTSDDHSHCELGHPHHAILIPSAAAYTDIGYLVQLARDNRVDAVHPGYGFLSENTEFTRRMWDEAGITVIGPGWETLAQTGDKLQAKQLAERCGVPVLAAMKQPSADLEEIMKFVAPVGYPVMIKAVDGGGGRGIRLVHAPEELPDAVNRAIGESPSRLVFVEKAAVGGFHHVEVQVIGDGTGEVRHLWERDCSIQRRFQKVVEFAPSVRGNRDLIHKVIDAALVMARTIQYRSLGTFEFLVSYRQSEFYFLEINPRLQVEHTITESIAGMDMVQTQLLLAEGYSFEELGLHEFPPSVPPPGQFSIQLRLCAEDPGAQFALSTGKVTELVIPGGHGVRIDSHVSPHTVVGTEFDNLLAKIIVTARTWEAAVHKARRVLADSKIVGVKSNLDLLRGIITEKILLTGDADTQWLQTNLDHILKTGKDVSAALYTQNSEVIFQPELASSSVPAVSNLLFRKGDTWSILLDPIEQVRESTITHNGKDSVDGLIHHRLQLSKILRNEFPIFMSAEIGYITPSSPIPVPYRLCLQSTAATPASITSSRRRGDPADPCHVVLPLTGKLTEMLVYEGDEIQNNQVVAFVKQMKMELEVRAPRSGKVKWAFEIDEESQDGEDVEEGMLLVEFEDDTHSLACSKPVHTKGKL